MSELGHFCPIDVAIAASEQEIAEFSEGATDKEIVAHDIVRDTQKRRRIFGRVCALAGECEGAVKNSQGYQDCPRRMAFAEALELQTVSGETVHPNGAMHSPVMMIRTRVLTTQLSPEDAIGELRKLGVNHSEEVVATWTFSNANNGGGGQYL